MRLLILIISTFFFSCSSTQDSKELDFNINKENYASGEVSVIRYSLNSDYTNVQALITNQRGAVVETFPVMGANGTYVINRMFPNADSYHKKDNSYFISMRFMNMSENSVSTSYKQISIDNSIVINSLCATDTCDSISGNVVQGVPYKISGTIIGIAASNILYNFNILEENISRNEVLESVTNQVFLDKIVFPEVPPNLSSYVTSINIVASDEEGNFAETSLPLRVVRPMEVKHFGKYELAEIYDPVPVSGCIQGALGNNVTYSESKTETRQNSISISMDRSWSNSNSESRGNVSSEGISLGETSSVARASSMAESETQSESYTNNQSTSNSDNYGFSSSDGENWSWSRGESEANSSSESSTSGTSFGGSVTVSAEVGTEGSLPFLAKASGKVGTSVGVNAGVNFSDTTGQTQTVGTNTGYSSGGTASTGTSFGTAQSTSQGSSLSGAYSYNSSTTSNLSETNTDSSTRVWNMSESLSSGKVLTTGERESINETIVESSSDTVTLSYSAYLPRGRFGVFYRQTSRWVKLSEIITYDLNGFPSHAGYISMNEWSWAPTLSVGNSCSEVSTPEMDEAYCFIPPCGG